MKYFSIWVSLFVSFQKMAFPISPLANADHSALATDAAKKAATGAVNSTKQGFQHEKDSKVLEKESERLAELSSQQRVKAAKLDKNNPDEAKALRKSADILEVQARKYNEQAKIQKDFANAKFKDAISQGSSALENFSTAVKSKAVDSALEAGGNVSSAISNGISAAIEKIPSPDTSSVLSNLGGSAEKAVASLQKGFEQVGNSVQPALRQTFEANTPPPPSAGVKMDSQRIPQSFTTSSGESLPLLKDRVAIDGDNPGGQVLYFSKDGGQTGIRLETKSGLVHAFNGESLGLVGSNGTAAIGRIDANSGSFSAFSQGVPFSPTQSGFTPFNASPCNGSRCRPRRSHGIVKQNGDFRGVSDQIARIPANLPKN